MLLNIIWNISYICIDKQAGTDIVKHYQVFLRERQAISIGASKRAMASTGTAIDKIWVELDIVITSNFQISDHELSLPTLSIAFTLQ